jgi:hypothetical protein
MRWLCEDGQLCRAGKVISFCNIGVGDVKQPKSSIAAFAAEARDFQAAFVLRMDGRVHIAADSSRGGFLDQHQYHQSWDPDCIIGWLETNDDQPSTAADPIRLLLAAGRRVTELAAARHALLSGWHDRSRAWWADGTGTSGTLLSLGSCEITAAIRGDQFNYLEIMNAVQNPSQLILVPDDLLVPCARLVLEQMRRTPEQIAEIAGDMAATFPLGSGPSAASDWLFLGGILSALGKSPATEENHIATRTAVQRVSRPDAIVMSLYAEPQRVLRHRRLGYTLSLYGYRIADAGPVVGAWLRERFEPVFRTPDDIRRDYLELVAAMQGPAAPNLLISNLMSSSGRENILHYAQFDQNMSSSLANVRNKEMNLMLHDLAAEADVAILDIDAIAAEIGAARHLPDGVHQSGEMHAEMRREILRILADRKVPGFSASSVK